MDLHLELLRLRRPVEEQKRDLTDRSVWVHSPPTPLPRFGGEGSFWD